MLTILVADDEEIIRSNFVKRIHRAQVSFDRILEAKNGSDALKIVEEQLIHVALIDINMPFLNGLELIKRMLQISPDTVIVIVSGFDRFEYAREAIEYGVFRYLVKPIDGEEFEQTIRLACDLAIARFRLTESENANYMRVAAMVHQNFANSDYSLSILAEDVGLSEGYITKTLKKEVGCTFSEFITRIRIDRAKKMLKAERNSVKIYEIAEAVGYKNQHYFSTVFKREVGVSPKEFASRA